MSETQRLQGLKSPKEREQLLAELLLQHQDRLRRMVKLRMDRRLKGRVSPSDVLQETFIESARCLDRYLEKPGQPFFLWIRFLAGMKLQALHRHHLGAQARDARREISLYRGAIPQATSEPLAATNPSAPAAASGDQPRRGPRSDPPAWRPEAGFGSAGRPRCFSAVPPR